MKKHIRLAVSLGIFMLLLFVLVAGGYAWKIQTKWDCCYPNPKERVMVICNDGRAPVYVNMGDRWCIKFKGRPDGDGRCFKTLDEAARWWCKE